MYVREQNVDMPAGCSGTSMSHDTVSHTMHDLEIYKL